MILVRKTDACCIPLMIAASFLEGIVSLDFWWNYLCGMMGALFVGYTAGMLFVVANALFFAARLPIARKGLALAMVYAVMAGVVAWMCFWKAGYNGFWIGFIFPGVFTMIQAFASAPKAVGEGLGVTPGGHR